jgi:hypothetical protein
MSKGFALAIILVFLTAYCVITAKPVNALPIENSWVEKASMHQARAWLGVGSANGKIYAIGGSTASGFEPATFPYGDINLDHFVGTNEEYDPTNNTWSYKASMPTSRMAFAIATVQDKIYCIGGRSVAGDMSGGYTAVNEVYDPKTNSWETKAPMPIANGWINAQVIDKKIYISDPSGGFFVYDPASNTWNSSVPTPPDGKLLLTYNPDGYETAGIMSPKMIYTFSDYNPVAKAYNPLNDSWQNGVASPIGRTGFGIAVANDIFYVVGGYTYEPWGPFAPVATNEEYVPFGYGTPDPSYVLENTPPQISFESPLNQTYYASSVSLVFTANKNISATSYSLDGQQNVSIVGNTTIDNIPDGLHSLTVYANDTYGNVGSQTVEFIVQAPAEIGSTTTIIVIASAVGIIFVIVGIFGYRRRQKKS